MILCIINIFLHRASREVRDLLVFLFSGIERIRGWNGGGGGSRGRAVKGYGDDWVGQGGQVF